MVNVLMGRVLDGGRFGEATGGGVVRRKRVPGLGWVALGLVGGVVLRVLITWSDYEDLSHREISCSKRISNS